MRAPHTALAWQAIEGQHQCIVDDIEAETMIAVLE